MASIFNSRPGVVQIVNAEQAIPGRIRIGGFDPKAILVSGMNYTQRTNQQFQYSLDRDVYVYMFGDLMGSLTVKGLIFPEMCSGEDGISEILKYYTNNRAVVKGESVSVAIGNQLIIGFMTELRLVATTGAYDAAPPTEEFEIIINTVPRD
jgi:hypothetical protein